MKARYVVIFLLFAFFVGAVNARFGLQEPQEVPLSSLSFIFDSGYLIDRALNFYPGYHPFNLESADYPGAAVLVGSREAILLLSDFREEVPSGDLAHALLIQTLCLAQEFVAIAYGEGYPYRVVMVSVQRGEGFLRFTPEMLKEIQKSPVCR